MPVTSRDSVPTSFSVKFASAGLAACFADLITFPLDTAKVRLQVGRIKIVSATVCLF